MVAARKFEGSHFPLPPSKLGQSRREAFLKYVDGSMHGTFHCKQSHRQYQSQPLSSTCSVEHVSDRVQDRKLALFTSETILCLDSGSSPLTSL